MSHPTFFPVKMGGQNDTDQITAMLGLPFNKKINQENFPLVPSRRPREDWIELIDPGCFITEEEGLEFLRASNLRPPTYEHGIRFAEQYGRFMMEERSYIVFPHKPWLDPKRHDLNIIYLCCSTAQRGGLRLGHPTSRLHKGCMLAGVFPHA